MGPVRVSRALAAIVGAMLLVAMAGCASEFERRYIEAERLHIEAAAKGFEWLATSDLLEQAQAEAAAGDEEAALALVERARFAANAALQQADREAEAWKRRVLK